MGYSYDAGGPRTAISYSSGTVALGYDVDNNLTSVANPFGENTGYAFDLAERLNTITLANGSVVSLRYDEADRSVYVGVNSTSAGGVGLSYGLDGNGNRVTITGNGGAQVVNADDANKRRTGDKRPLARRFRALTAVLSTAPSMALWLLERCRPVP